MTDLQRSARPVVSPAARALRLQRIFARLQEGASDKTSRRRKACRASG